MNKKVKFGWRVPDFPVDGSHGSEFRDQIFACLDELQEAFDSAWVADHFVPWYRATDPSTATLEAWTALTYLAGRYPHLLFGTAVLSQSYRPPALLAKMGAILQALSGGRFVLGIGAGWKEDEYRAYGYDFPPGSIRVGQLSEAVKIIRLMWTEPRATYHGRYYHIENAICEPKPDPLPPILIGGGGKKLTLRVVAEQADWWNFPNCTVERYTELLEVLRGHCEAVGRDYDSIVKTWSSECVAVAQTTEKAEQMARASPFFKLGPPIFGTPGEVAARLKPFIDLGVQHFMLRFADFPKADSAKMFTREVAPSLNKG
jgi:alkanesulfonate monooxygenase SsuD/methylene tetrahydromethanopterin reductase-like flavin-dependent oxidoreductase (luciferase family)